MTSVSWRPFSGFRAWWATARQTRSILMIWLGWAALMFAFQPLVLSRFDLVRPDQALDWTAAQTGSDRLQGHPYLASPLLGAHTAWDSEYYISIALHGYDDPDMPAASPDSQPDTPIAGRKGDHPGWVALNHAFFPGYPLAMALLARPAIRLGAPPIPAAVLAGLAVSLLGTLGAMFSIADLAGFAGGSPERIRAAFYLCVWPGSIFLAQVYSEGLFVGLSFGALALLRRRRPELAALLAVAAVFTRPTGVLLQIPFAWTWWTRGPSTSPARLLVALAPTLAWVAWRLLLGGDFGYVESRYFGRGPFAVGASWDAWLEAARTLRHGAHAARAAVALEILAVVAAIAGSVLLWPRDKPLTLYGLALLAVAATSGAAVGMQRYVVALPALFLAPARLGREPAIDRLWTLWCCLGLAVLALAFSFGFWAG